MTENNPSEEQLEKILSSYTEKTERAIEITDLRQDEITKAAREGNQQKTLQAIQKYLESVKQATEWWEGTKPIRDIIDANWWRKDLE